MGRERDAPRRSGTCGASSSSSSTRYCRRTFRAAAIAPKSRSHADSLDIAAALIAPLLELSDDPEYRATYAEILAARGEREAAVSEAERAAAIYERLLARRPEAYADHAAAFFMSIGNRPQRAVELACANWKLRDTPRSRRLLDKALRNAEQVSRMQAQPTDACAEEIA